MTATIEHAIEVLPAGTDQTNRNRWLNARQLGIGGSDASTVVGVNPWSTRYELYLDKTGQLPAKEQTQAMRMGHLLEPVLRQIFTEDTGIGVRPAGLLRSLSRPFMQVSLDGYTEDGGIFEAKTTNWRLADEWDDDQVSDHAEVQIQHGLAVTGRSHGWAVVLIDGREPRIRRVERDDNLIADLCEMERAFWFDHVQARIEPAPTAGALDVIKDRFRNVITDITAGDPLVVEPLIDQWKAAKAAEKQAGQDKAAAEANLRHLIGTAEALAVLGENRLTCKANGTFAAKRFALENPELAADLTITVPGLDMARLKTEHPDIYQAYRARVLREATPKGK